MITTPMTRRTLLGTALLTGLAACSSNDPLNSDGSGSGSADLIVGSANFTESEIIAEVYAQSLETVGITIKRRMQIGARDVYVKALQDGSVNLVPEYSGNLLQFFQGHRPPPTRSPSWPPCAKPCPPVCRWENPRQLRMPIPGASPPNSHTPTR